MVRSKIASSLTKVYIDTAFDGVNELKSISALKGERLSFQLVSEFTVGADDDQYAQKKWLTPKLSGSLSEYVTLRKVGNVAVELPVNPTTVDEHFERYTPGLYPDVLSPLTFGGRIVSKNGLLTSTWIDVTIPEDTTAVGRSALTIGLFDDNGAKLSESSIEINVINAKLPEQSLILTNWFHCDGLADYYECEVFSEKHWKIIENFARVAYKNGINMILTPTFTPPLDTAVGGERTTVQLVGVNIINGKITFDFSLVDRWIDMCDRIGFKYFEIAHLFTQWGAAHAPKIMATVDGEYKKIFGWETDSSSKEYITFIRQFLTEFIEHMKKRGDDKRCVYHISDEPELHHLDTYLGAKNSVADVLDGYVIMDAISSFELYEKGIVDLPIPVNDHIAPFIEANVPGLWTYYCCGQCVKVSNRLIAMPSARNRSIGMQLYKFDIVGFLHWGYNFYNNHFSYDLANPFTDLSGEHWVPAGDTFSVYPGHGGVALESLRILVFHDAIQDLRAMQLCEKYYSKEEVVGEIEKILGTTLTFDVCAYDENTMLAIRAKINEMIEKSI